MVMTSEEGFRDWVNRLEVLLGFPLSDSERETAREMYDQGQTTPDEAYWVFTEMPDDDE